MTDLHVIQQRIFDIRGVRVMFDFHMSDFYGIETRRLKEAAKRNIERFPDDFMFELSAAEWKNLRTQFATSSWGGSRYLPYAFTEQGVAMLSSVFQRPCSVDMSYIE